MGILQICEETLQTLVFIEHYFFMVPMKSTIFIKFKVRQVSKAFTQLKLSGETHSYVITKLYNSKVMLVFYNFVKRLKTDSARFFKQFVIIICCQKSENVYKYKVDQVLKIFCHFSSIENNELVIKVLIWLFE